MNFGILCALAFTGVGNLTLIEGRIPWSMMNEVVIPDDLVARAAGGDLAIEATPNGSRVTSSEDFEVVISDAPSAVAERVCRANSRKIVDLGMRGSVILCRAKEN